MSKSTAAELANLEPSTPKCPRCSRVISFSEGQSRRCWNKAIKSMRAGFDAVVRERDAQRLAAYYDAERDRERRAMRQVKVLLDKKVE